jgi:hypothetical protein
MEKKHNYTGTNNIAGDIVQHCPVIRTPVPQDDVAPINVRICVFFDGTLNNRTNVDIGIAERSMHLDEKLQRKGSYCNEHTNVDKLEKCWIKDPDADLSFSLYIEGVGTIDEQCDENMDAALGTGKTGVLAKVHKGMEQIIYNFVKKAKSNNIDNIYLDAFGFSRGAAAARYFIYNALEKTEETLKHNLIEKGFSLNSVQAKFVGLYDTVASYQIDHSDDTEQLHLDAIGKAERVVQIAAADEHRKNFRLTNINSAPNRLQIFIPGSHSDIGGGYCDNSEERFTIFYYRLPENEIDRFDLAEDDMEALKKEKYWLIESGWYLKEEIEYVVPAFSGICSLKVARSNIGNSYDRIPLKLMIDFALEGGVHFTQIEKNDVIPELKAVEGCIQKYISTLNSDQSKPNDWFEINVPVIKALRHNYLHFSSQYFGVLGAHDPNYTMSDPKRGARQRIIQNG